MLISFVIERSWVQIPPSAYKKTPIFKGSTAGESCRTFILSMVCLLDLSHNYCGIGILPVQDSLFGRCLFRVWRAGEARIQGTKDLIEGAQLFSSAQTN